MPVVIESEEDRKKITQWLQTEISKAKEERRELLQWVQKWRRQSEARPEHESKSRPWKNSSNVTVPLSGSLINGVYADYKNSMQRLIPLCNVKAIESERQEQLNQAKALELMVSALIESKNHIGLRPKNNTILYDTARLGTQFVRTKWATEKRNFKRKSAGVVETVASIVRNTPDVEPLRFEQFLTRPHYYSIQDAPWVATIHRLYEHQLDQREAQGLYENVDVVRGMLQSRPPEEVQEELDRHGMAVQDMDHYEIYEIFFYWDVDGDGWPEDVIWWFEPLTGTVLREDFNDLGRRPLVGLKYFGRPWEIYGMGIGWMAEHMQDELDAIHNMRIDGTHLAMLQMLVAQPGGQIGPNEEMYPGKIFLVNDPKNNVLPLRFPPIAGDTYQAEANAKYWAETFTGMPGPARGMQDDIAKTRATVGGTAMLLNRNDSLRDAIKESLDTGYGEVFENIVYHLVRNRDEVERSLLHLIPQEYHGPLMEALTTPVEELPLKFAFTVATSESDETEESKRQGLLTFSQMYMTYGQQMFALLPIVYDQTGQVPEPLKQAAVQFIVGGTKMMDNILKGFGFEDTSDYVMTVPEMELMLDVTKRLKEEDVRRTRSALEGRFGAGGGANAGGPGGAAGTGGAAPGAGGVAGPPGPAG